MARVTVEDCIDKVDNRFDLVLLAAHRARMISSGSQLTVDRDNDKNPVVSLREIADSSISPEDLREELVHSLQKFVEVDEPEPDTVPLIGSAGACVDADDRAPRSDLTLGEERQRPGAAPDVQHLLAGRELGRHQESLTKAPFPAQRQQRHQPVVPLRPMHDESSGRVRCTRLGGVGGMCHDE